MKKYHFLTRMFCFAICIIGPEAIKAEETVKYHKAGEVGVFCAEFAIPAGVNIYRTVFTARASNEKAYLLYIHVPQSMVEGLTKVMESQRYHSSPEQEQLQKEMRELYEKNGEITQNLQEARNELKALKSISESAKKENDEVLLGKTQLKIDEAEQRIAELEALDKELRQQLREVHRKYAEAQMKGPERIEQELEITSLQVLGRFKGSGDVKIDVYARDSAELLAEVNLVESLELHLPSIDTENPELLKEWATAQAGCYMVRVLDSPYTSYYQYCLLQSKQKYGLPDYIFLGSFPERMRDSGPDLYAMTTGALAIQESLQLEEMTGREAVPMESTVPVNSLEGPNIKSHPFDEMIQGRDFKMFPVARLIPYDNYYCHFTSISKEIAARDLIKQWGTSLLRAMSVSARDADLPSRYQDQLCIDISTLTRLFGELVIGEVAITGGDPFLREGSDVAIIIQVKNRMVFNGMMKSYADKALKANPDAKRTESSYNGISIQSIATPDRSINSHSAYIDDYKVYTNSMDTLKLIIDTHSQKRKSMADNVDFKYMRTIFHGTAETEDGFIYMSDSFIRKLLSARWKIEAQRRIICQNHLRMIGNAATMYRTEMRKQASVSTLVDEEYLSKKITQCPDNGTYSLNESGRAFCTVHNCLQYCTPISGVAIDKAADVEAKDYREFVERYNNYWSRYFDPIGIRFKLGNQIEIETCILPLIENSIYNQLREIVGGEPVELNTQLITDGTIISLGGKFNLDGDMTRQIQMMQQQMFPTMPGISSAFGDNLSINLYDSDVLFTFSESGMNMFSGWMGLEEQIIFGLIASSINLPVYAVLDLKDEALAETFIQEMLKVLQRKFSAEGRRGFAEFGIEPYSAGEYKGHEIDTLACRLFVIKFRLYYAIASNRLIVSTKRYVLEKALDAIDTKQASDMANLQLKVRPRAFDKLRPIIKVGWQERMRDACLKNIGPVRVLVECHDATEKTLNAVSKKVEGVTMRCPSGGKYRYDNTRDIVYCSVHGNRNHPKQPLEVNENEGLIDFLNRMNDFYVSFRFTEEGIMTKIAVDLEPKD
ncbi:MAG: hypothetical protein JSW23_07305 [Planctomycetota bacterium]|nr:MAG: hypothetical protein JSW23_07305 [Planctomycetota bacterium]